MEILVKKVLKKAAIGTSNSIAKTGGETIVKDLFSTYVKPKLDKIANKPKCTDIILELLEEYLENAYNRNKYISTIVFKKETKTIEELYVPLTMVKNGKNVKDKIVINSSVYNFFEKTDRILLLDNAGMGKSTLLKFIYLHCLKNKYGIPFLIELRKVQDKTLQEYICNEICLSKKELNNNDINFLIERGDFIFFLDGFDEVANEQKEEMIENIRMFLCAYPKNKIMMTSREDEYVNIFNEFIKYHIQPLKKDEAYQLIKKYDKNGEFSQKLIYEIENHKKYDILKEFLTNPLMVSLLYSSYSYKEILQYKKHLFYGQVYDALYEGHDIVKGSSKIHDKKSKLDIEDFNRLLSAIGFLSIKKGKVEFEKNEIYEMIEQGVHLCGCEENVVPKYFLDDILHSVPMFVEEGVLYKWTHKSFAEYYAAYFICFIEKQREYEIISSMMKARNNMEYHNVLDFCYDMDGKLAKELIIYNTISSYIDFCDKYSIDLSKVETKKVNIAEMRRYYDYIQSTYIVKLEKNIVDEKSHLNVDRVIESYSIYKENCEEDMSEGIIISRNYNIVMFINRLSNYENVRLLYDKNLDIYKSIKVQDYNMKFFENIKPGFYQVGKSNELNDEQKIIALMSCVHHNDYSMDKHILDYEKCIKLKEKLEKNMKKKEENIFDFS